MTPSLSPSSLALALAAVFVQLASASAVAAEVYQYQRMVPTLSVAAPPASTGGSSSTTPAANPAPAPVAVPGLSASTLNFGTVKLGQSSTSQSVLLTNSGNALLNLTSAPAASGDFSASTNCGQTLAAGAACQVDVTFTPTLVGARSGSLQVATDAGSLSTALTGEGQGVPTADLSTSTLAFGSTVYVGSSSTLAVRLTNNGSAELALTAAPSFSGNAAFSIVSGSSNCGSSLAAGAYCDTTVRFLPTSTSAVTGTVTFATNAGDKTVALSGTGFQTGVVMTASSPTGVLPPVMVGQVGGLTYSFKNIGATALPNVYMAFTGTAPLTVDSNTCGTSAAKVSVAAGATCTVTVKYAPSSVGSSTGSIAFYSPNTAGFSYSSNISASSFSGTVTSQTFNYIGAVDTSFVAPRSGTYTVEVWGAQSGPRVNYSWAVDTRGGAYMKCAVNIDAGSRLKIMVGGQGKTSSGNIGAGGGTFVTLQDNTPLAVGGGGGGGWANYSGTGGQITNNGTTLGGAGAGLTGDASATCGAKSFVNGGAGGGTLGGYGGGGGSGACGGGGGYNGGAQVGSYTGAGGGSYCQMYMIQGIADNNYSGNGKVVISY